MAVTPATVFIQQGATTTVYPVRISGVGVGAASITASAFNLTCDTEIVQVSTRAPSVGFSPTGIIITGTGTQNVLLSLSTAAPPGGLLLNLRSDDRP